MSAAPPEATPAADVDYDAFRREVRDFLDAEYPAEKRAMNERQAGLLAEPELGQWWHRTLARKGWIAPGWPVEHGGTGWDAIQRRIFSEECAIVNAPRHAVQGLVLVAPALMRFGTQAQKEFFLPCILSGEMYFCQGFSEPGAGSDLASLQTAAVRDGADYVVNGSKIWTTHAHHANWIFVLVRTGQTERPQAGISFLLAPMDTPGISVRPIISMTGEHELNQVFFDDARVPVAHRVGEENQGWEVTKFLLQFERGAGIAAVARGAIEFAKRIARAQPGTGEGSLWDDHAFRRRVALAEIETIALEATEMSVVSDMQNGRSVGDAVAAILKIGGAEVYQTITELCADALGPYAIADQRHSLLLANENAPIGPAYAVKPTAKYFNARATSIFGGASEVLKNLLWRHGL